jgi:hypothetical protein
MVIGDLKKRNIEINKIINDITSKIKNLKLNEEIKKDKIN